MRIASLRSKCLCLASVFCHSARLHRLRAQLFRSASLACASQVCAASASVLHPCFATPRDSTGYVLSFSRVLAWHARHQFAQQVHLSCVRVLPLRETPPATCSAFPGCFFLSENMAKPKENILAKSLTSPRRAVPSRFARVHVEV